jgi:RNA polymerase sigma factor (sigma-70 family)
MGFHGVGSAPKIRSITSILKPREFVVMQLHFRTGLTQREIGQSLGLSQQAISIILDVAMARLRNAGNFVVDFDPEEN